jgi:hypothetical protein
MRPFPSMDAENIGSRDDLIFGGSSLSHHASNDENTLTTINTERSEAPEIKFAKSIKEHREKQKEL